MISMCKSSTSSSKNHQEKIYFCYNRNKNNFVSLIYLIIKFNIQLMISFFLVIQLLNKPLGIKSSLLFNSNNYIGDEDVSSSLSSKIDLHKNSKFLKYNEYNNHNSYDSSNYDHQNNLNRKTILTRSSDASTSTAATDFLFHSFNSFTTSSYFSSHHSKHLSRYNSTRLKIKKNYFIPSHRSMLPYYFINFYFKFMSLFFRS
jgi:hypothetical protein